MSIDDLEQLSGKKRRAKLDEIRAACQHYLKEQLRPELEHLLVEAIEDPDESVGVVLDDADPDSQTLLVRYPSALPANAYVRSEVRIECGAKSALDPHEARTVRPYVDDDLPDIDLIVGDITTIQPERTFWDKVVIVHGLRGWFENRGELRQEGQRVSRHYYDLHVMFLGETGERAVTDRPLGAECVRHARMFFNRPDFKLETAAAGTFALKPADNMLDALRRDYEAMAGMIIGPVPRFNDVMVSIASLERVLNESEQSPSS